MTLCRNSGWANARPVPDPGAPPAYETAECFDCDYRGPLVEIPEKLGLPGTRQVLAEHCPVRRIP